MKSLEQMTAEELSAEFDLYASETGLDRESDYDQEEAFAQWLEDNEIELEDEDE